MKAILLSFAAAAALSCCVSCSFRVAPDLKPETSALATVPDRGFAGEIKRMAAARPGLSGFAMIPGNREAFEKRFKVGIYSRLPIENQL